MEGVKYGFTVANVLFRQTCEMEALLRCIANVRFSTEGCCVAIYLA